LCESANPLAEGFVLLYFHQNVSLHRDRNFNGIAHVKVDICPVQIEELHMN